MTDKNLIRLVYILLILFSIKYVSFIVKVPFTFFFVDYKAKSSFAGTVKVLKKESQFLTTQNSVGFISDVRQARVLDEVESVKNFYIAQYAVVPAVLKNDTDEKFVVGIFEKSTNLPPHLKIYKKISNNIYIFKRSDLR